MTRRFLVNILVGLLFFTSVVSQAVEVKNLYQAKVAVESQRSQDRKAAIRTALQTVLVKVSGHREVLDNKEIKKASGKAEQLLTDFRYTRDGEKMYVVINFNEQKINQLLVDNSLPIWGRLRPQLVLWLADENKLQRSILHKNNMLDIQQAISEFEALRGVPTLIPDSSTIESGIINTTDVWGRFEQPVLAASKEYAPEGVIIVRLSDNSLLKAEQLDALESCTILCPKPIAVDWSFQTTDSYDAVPQYSERYYGVDKQLLLKQALADIADLLASKYALAPTENQRYEIEVANVDSLQEHVKITRFLQELSAVKAVTLVGAKGSIRRFSLNLIGNEQAFLASLKLNRSLTRYFDPLDPSSKEGIPLFYWESK